MYHKCKRTYDHSKSDDNLVKLKSESKKYKRIIKVSMNKFEKVFNNKLRVIKNANPQEYCKLLCTIDKTEVVSKIHIDVLSEHFKKLNNDENIYDEHDKKFVDVNVDEWSVNKYINEDICQSEIRKIVSDLKNNKSQGVDQILNLLKALLTCYVQFM